MANSLVIEQIELIGPPGGTPSTDPRCAGAVFRLQPGFDLGEHQPVVDFVATMLDGERPYGRRSGNRTITLPLQVTAPDFGTLAGALEVLMQAVDQPMFTLTWTRDSGMPLVLDCNRANPSDVTYGGADQWFINPVAQLTVTFTAAPYGRADVPSTVLFTSPLAGQSAPPSPLVLDNYSTVSGTNWSQSSQHTIGPKSAHFTPPATPTAATYAKTFAAADVTGLTALSVWLGMAYDTARWSYWSGFTQNVLITVTLTDNAAHTLSFSATRKAPYSNSTTPKWTLVSVPIPQGSATFDYAHVTGYSVKLSNFTGTIAGQPNVTNGYYPAVLIRVAPYLDALTANPPSVKPLAAVRGAVYQMLDVAGTARAPLSLQFSQPLGSAPVTVTLTPASTQWICPPGVTVLTSVECWGGGGAGGNLLGAGVTGGGGGGGYSKETNVAAVPGRAYTVQVSNGGVIFSGGFIPTADTFFAGDAVTVTAHSGANAPGGTSPGAGGAVSTNTVKFSGASGGTGSSPNAGGGGSSAGTAANGNAGGAPAGGAAPAGGGAGGAGATSGNTSGTAGATPGGGSGGCSSTGGTVYPNPGGAGQIKITYTSTVVTPFSTLIAHSPGPDAPPDLSPLIAIPATDVPAGSTEYPVPSLASGVYADFHGTYSAVIVASSWNSPSAARTVTVTVKQYEYQGGPSYSTSTARTFTPSADVTNGIVTLGELTLPLKDAAPDNTSGYYTVTVADTNTSDRFMDLMFLDTMGSTVMVNIPSAGANAIYYIDEPEPDRGTGRVLGTDFDRAQAISVLDQCPVVSGGPLAVYPRTTNLLLAYAVEGAPTLGVSYLPRYYLDRI